MLEVSEEKARKNGWIDTWFAIEVLGGSVDIVERSLKEHIEKLAKTESICVYKTDFHPVQEVKNPPKPLKQGWTKIVNISLLVKDLYTLINTVMMYGPSAIEILSPPSKQVSASEMQNIVNTIAGLLHQFAAAGIGGIILTPKENKQ